MDRIVLATAASFQPFAGGGSALSADGGAPRNPRRVQGVLIASGLAIAPVTSSQCPMPAVDGTSASFRAVDEEHGLALLGVATREQTAAALAEGLAEAPHYALFGASGGLSVAPASFEEGAKSPIVKAPIQRGITGAAIITRAGRLVGLARAPGKAPPSINGTMLTADYALADATSIRTLMVNAGVPSLASVPDVPERTLSEAVAAWRPLLVTVTCSPASGDKRTSPAVP